MVDDEPVTPDPAVWDDGQWLRAVALAVFDAEAEDPERFDESPDYDW